MKTQILIIVALLLGSSAFSRINTEPCIVITNHDTTICEKVSMHFNKLVMKLFDGTTVNVNKSSVSTFTSEGRVFERKNLYINNKPTGEFVLMEVMGQKSGLRLYRFNFEDASAQVQKIINQENIENSSLFMVYKNDNFLLQLSKYNETPILSLFNLRVTYK